MKPSQQRFFIALLPPQEVQQTANQIKQYFAEVYNSQAALKSPPHVTLQSPFEWDIDKLPILEKHLHQFSQSQFPVPMTLQGFAAFKPRVIYINVLRTLELLTIQQNLARFLESSLNIVHPTAKNQTFTPHLTVAYRDLTQPNFYTAWTEFETKELYFEFVVEQLTLLFHDGNRWKIHQEYNIK